MRIRSGPRSAFAIVVAVALLVAPVAVPQACAADAAQAEAEQVARKSFQRGEVHFRAGRFPEALAEYKAGYAASPLPGFLINIAQCQRRMGDLKTARTTYQRFLIVAPDSPLVPEVKELIAELDRLTTAEGENAARAETTPPPAATPPPPPGTTTAAKPSAARVPSLAAPDPSPTTNGSRFAPAKAERSADPSIDDSPSRTRWWLWGTIAAVVVGGTVTVFAIRSPEMETLDAGTLGTLRR